MTWRDSPMVGFDTETDGPDPEDARIITACVGVASSEGWKPQSWMVRPERAAYRGQKGSLMDHFARQGKPFDDPSRDWPVRPYPQAVTQAA